MAWKAKPVQGGIRRRALCQNCNNITGAWYNSAYVKLARACIKHAKPDNIGKKVPVSISSYPCRLFKQALALLCATSQPGFCEVYSEARKLILEREYYGLPKHFRVWLFLMLNPGLRSTGLTGSYNIKRSEAMILAEFSCRPLGWILSLSKEEIEGAIDVTCWSECSYWDKQKIVIEVPCQLALTASPGDFRLPEELFNIDGSPKW